MNISNIVTLKTNMNFSSFYFMKKCEAFLYEYNDFQQALSSPLIRKFLIIEVSFEFWPGMKTMINSSLQNLGVAYQLLLSHSFSGISVICCQFSPNYKICVEQLICCQKCRANACRAIAIRAVHPHSCNSIETVEKTYKSN